MSSDMSRYPRVESLSQGAQSSTEFAGRRHQPRQGRMAIRPNTLPHELTPFTLPRKICA